MIAVRLLLCSLCASLPMSWPMGGGLARAEEGAAHRKVSFLNDVLPVLTRAGCNAGACHGAEAGKGGFKLSLRGYAPELDHRAIRFDLFARRIDLARPEESLLLRKPSLLVPHQGGEALPVGSEGRRIVRDWIAEGAPGPLTPGDGPGEAYPVSLSIEPAGGIHERGARLALRVEARFSDGSLRDVTRWSRFETSDGSVASVDAEGNVQALGPGLSALSASYQGLFTAVEALVPFGRAGEGRSGRSFEPAGFIDERLMARWDELRLRPAPPIDDAAFLRRLHLDLTGVPPAPDEARSFLADPHPDRRARAVDRLLEDPRFADFWTQKWGDVLRISREWLGEKPMWQIHRWLREQIARNVPWDHVVRELVAGAGDSSREGPPNFYRLQKVFNEPELWPLVAAETTAQTFLGLRMGCARCHNHPSDRWTQDDYYGLAAFFARTAVKPAPGGGLVVHDRAEGEIVHPRRGRALPPRLLDGTTIEDGDRGAAEPRRARLARWITDPANPWFARATANRIWKHFFGRGLVEPVDDFRASNPPTHPALLDDLARDLVEHRFDLRRTIRSILLSRAYALSSEPGGAADTAFYSRFIPRRMTAEGLLDALGQATGVREPFPGLPAGFRAVELPDTRAASPFLDGFGRPLRRQASCECERIGDPSLGQALELMNSAAIQARLAAAEGMVARKVAEGAADRAIVEEIWLSCLSRPPSAAEAAAALAELGPGSGPGSGPGAVERAANRREVLEDLLWALLNSKEFLLNH